jgi:Flp pilus assembly protein TadB
MSVLLVLVLVAARAMPPWSKETSRSAAGAATVDVALVLRQPGERQWISNSGTFRQCERWRENHLRRVSTDTIASAAVSLLAVAEAIAATSAVVAAVAATVVVVVVTVVEVSVATEGGGRRTQSAVPTTIDVVGRVASVGESVSCGEVGAGLRVTSADERSESAGNDVGRAENTDQPHCTGGHDLSCPLSTTVTTLLFFLVVQCES